MRKTVLLVVVALLVASQAFAFPGYQTYNFGDASTIFDHNNNWSPIDYPYVGNLPSPGFYNPGGEHYDLEGLNVAVDDNFIHLSLTNSFGFQTADGFRLGDLFIGVDGGDKYQYAMDLQAGGSNGGIWEVNDSWNDIQDISNSYYNYPAIRSAVGAHEIDFRSGKASFLGNASSVWSSGNWELTPLNPGVYTTYVWEMTIDKSLINGGNFSSLAFHVNIGCGNDLMEENYTSAVPEPATLLLFGVGLLGAGIIRRYKVK